MAKLDASDPLRAVIANDHFGLIRDPLFAYVKHLRSVDLKDVPPEHSRDLFDAVAQHCELFPDDSDDFPGFHSLIVTLSLHWRIATKQDARYSWMVNSTRNRVRLLILLFLHFHSSLVILA